MSIRFSLLLVWAFAVILGSAVQAGQDPNDVPELYGDHSAACAESDMPSEPAE